MKKRIRILILLLIALILEILPYGAVCNFMRPSADGTSVGRFRELYSYFDLTPFGYANFAPMITAVLTCVLVLLIVIYCFTGRPGLFNTIRTFVWICTVISLGPLVLGIRFYSCVGGLCTMAFIAELFLLYSTLKNQITASCE